MSFGRSEAAPTPPSPPCSPRRRSRRSDVSGLDRRQRITGRVSRILCQRRSGGRTTLSSAATTTSAKRAGATARRPKQLRERANIPAWRTDFKYAADPGRVFRCRPGVGRGRLRFLRRGQLHSLGGRSAAQAFVPCWAGLVAIGDQSGHRSVWRRWTEVRRRCRFCMP